MSDLGLQGSIYEQLRSYVDQLDHALVGLRNPQPHIAEAARQEIAGLLREITDEDSTNPTSRLVMVILRQRLPAGSGRGLARCIALASALEHRPPDTSELAQLEEVALALDKECSHTLARIKGK